MRCFFLRAVLASLFGESRPIAAHRETFMLASDFIAPLRFDTRDLPAELQFEAWRAFHSSVIDVSLNQDARAGFQFEQKVWNLGKLAFTAARMPGPLVPRRWQHLRKEPIDHWCLVLPDSGSNKPQIADGVPRQVHFRSLGRPFDGAAADTSVMTLYIPRDFFRTLAGTLDAHAGSLSPGGLGALLADFLIALERRLPSIPAKDMPQLVEAMRVMITACIAPTPDRLAEAGEEIAFTVLERARRIIQRDLFLPGLGPDSLCRQLGISRSKLYRLFEPLNGVGRYIQRRRLLAAYEALSDSLSARSVGELAELLCYSDAAALSRAFRNEMGRSPSDVRAAARMGLLLSPPAPPNALRGMADLGDILRHLQI